MSQSPGEERRKFVFVFTGSPSSEGLPGKSLMELMESVGNYGEKIIGWHLAESHSVSLDTSVRVGDEAKAE
jgi:hypothetical protein